jgi:2'-hydroxyisoflavone reductase
MRLLLLGGTKFLGRHCVDAALSRGHAVTLFTRGRAPNHWGDAVEMRTGDRDPAIAPGLAALAAGTWDAVIDTSGYVPRVVRASAAMLRGRVGQYLFVSSMSVYVDASRPGVDESSPVATLDEPATEDIAKNYGALKACCEDEIRGAFGGGALVVRPGLIVGPHDATDRFGYWVARFRRPVLLGDRPAVAAVPAPATRPVQFIDARDLASWIVDLVEARASGMFNACSPAGLWTFGSLVDALGTAPGTPSPQWIDEATLLEHKVEPWTGLPLWIPSTFADMAGFMECDSRKAEAAGLRVRALGDTIDATAAWLCARDNAPAWKAVLSGAAERELLAMARPGRSAGARSVR